MILSTTRTTTLERLVGMGQIAVGSASERLGAILGSCIGLAIHHPRLKTGGVAHIVLPDSSGRAGTPGKFADTALPHMLALLADLGVPVHGLTAKLAGGANMFGASGPMQIGRANVEAVTRLLRVAGVRVAAQDVGGTRGRRVTFDCASGDLVVECAGHPPRTL